MAFKGITFAGQNVTPKNDGGLYAGYLGDGIIWGCEMAISGDDLVIQSGEIIVGGRVVQVDGATNVDLSGRTLQTGYIQVILNADISQGEGSQWYTTFVESATTTFPNLTFGDINNTDTLHQYELAIIQISGGNLSSIVRTGWHTRILMNDDGAGNRVGMFGFWESNLHSYTYEKGSGNPLAGFRTSSTDDAIIFAPNQRIYLRPAGSNVSTPQTYFDKDGWANGFGFHVGSSGYVDRIGDFFIYRRADVASGAMTAGTFKTIDTISDANWRPNAQVDTGFAYGYNPGQNTPIRYGKVRINTSGQVLVSVDSNVSSTVNLTIFAMWRNPSWTP